MEVALDYALNARPTTPGSGSTPNGSTTARTARSPTPRTRPRSTRTSIPLNFWPPAEADRVALWEACKEIIDFWVRPGRPDLPGGQPAHQAVRLLGVADQRDSARSTPTSILLAEAFTRPKVMARLAEVGFSQSYTYFTWRTDQHGPEGIAGLRRRAGPRPAGRLHAAQLLAQHAGHPVGPAAGRAAGRLRPAFRAGRHPVPVLRHLQRLRAVRERAGVG